MLSRRHELGRFPIGGLDKAQNYTPILYEGNGPAPGLFRWHSDTRTQLGHARLSKGQGSESSRCRTSASLSGIGSLPLPGSGRVRSLMPSVGFTYTGMDQNHRSSGRECRGFIEAPHGAAVLDDHIIEPISISRG
jgi:hypothetical protein